MYGDDSCPNQQSSPGGPEGAAGVEGSSPGGPEGAAGVEGSSPGGPEGAAGVEGSSPGGLGGAAGVEGSSPGGPEGAAGVEGSSPGGLGGAAGVEGEIMLSYSGPHKVNSDLPSLPLCLPNPLRPCVPYLNINKSSSCITYSKREHPLDQIEVFHSNTLTSAHKAHVFQLHVHHSLSCVPL